MVGLPVIGSGASGKAASILALSVGLMVIIVDFLVLESWSWVLTILTCCRSDMKDFVRIVLHVDTSLSQRFVSSTETYHG